MGLHVYRFKNGKWGELIDPISVHCEQIDEGMDFIQKSSQKGYVTVRESKFYDNEDDSGIKAEKREVKMW